MMTLKKINILLAAIFLLMIFFCVKIYHMDFPITNFDNLILGMAAAKNIDISKAILWYAIYAVPLCFLFAWLFGKSVLYDKAINFFGNIKIRQDESRIFFVIVLLSVLILSPHDTINLILINCFASICFFARDAERAAAAWVSSLFIFSLPIFCLTLKFAYLENLMLIFAITASICFCLMKNFSKIFAKLYPFLIAGITSFILLNVLEILLTRGGNVSDKILFVPYILAALSLIFLKVDSAKNYERKILRGTIILMIFSYSPILGNGGYIDFFEGSNQAISIQNFIQYGELPLINNLDAHMLSWIVGGLSWFAMTGDYFGAFFSPYGNLIFMTIGLPSFFYLLKKFLPEQQAFVCIAIFPLNGILATLPGFIAIPAFIFWKNNPNFFRSLIVQIIISALCLYRIDLGASFGFALFLTPILFCAFRKNYKSLGKYIFAAILWASIFFAVVFFGLHFEFAEEFLTAFNSNQHWAYGDLGKSFRVIPIYFIFPAVTAILFLPVLRKFFHRSESETDWMILFLYATFIFGISRMMARHTLVEHNSSIFAAGIFLLALLTINFCRKYKAAIFIGLFFICTMFCVNSSQTSIFMQINSVSAAVNSVHNEEHQFFKNFTEEDKNQIELMKNFFDENLCDDETYFDFTDQSVFFATTGRKNPIYINQCPAMINGVKGQLQALDRLKNNPKVKFVVMPYLQRKNVPYGCYYHLDGLLNFDRHHLLTEWICKNYQPYKQVGDFYVWQQKNSDAAEPPNYNYELPENHFHNLGYIPQLLGKSSVESELIEIPADENGALDLKNVVGKIGFITLEISSDVDAEVQLKLRGDGINDVVFQFKLAKGTHLYRLRASSDVLWYSDKIKTLEVENLAVNKIYFEEISE